MTIGILKMPRMGETMEEGKLVDWLVKTGEPFKRGQDILEVETDKTIVEFPALGDGIVVETLVGIGDMVPVGTPIARIDVGDGPDWTDDGSSAAGAAPEQSRARQPAPETALDEGSPVSTHAPKADMRQDARLRATPLARKIARQAGIDPATIAGTGRRGRVERADVEAAAASASGAAQAAGVAYCLKGPAQGDAVLLLHGFGGDSMVWNGVQARLAQAGRRSVSMDLPAHGATRHDARSPDDLAAPIATALEELSIAPAHIVGHSMGAIPAVRLARAPGVRSLTLIAPAGIGHRIDAQFLTGLAHAQTAGEVSHLLDRITEGPHGLSSAMLAQIYDQLARGRLKALSGALVGGSGQAVSIRADLTELAERMPVRIIIGHRDQILDWQDVLGLSPRIAIHHLPRAGHSPHWEALSDVAAILNEVTK